MNKKKILIGGAWPYANNSMHIGHLAALLPGDILARFFRQRGDEVLYVSGSDCHGTPITVRAEKLGISPEVIANHYHKEFTSCFEKLNFSYDLYTNTMTDFHKNIVQKIFKKIKDNGYLYEEETKQDYCDTCGKFVSDRELTGICPICGTLANGDQCDKCLTALTPDMLIDKKCKSCGKSTTIRNNKHIYFKMSALTDIIKDYVNKNDKTWRQTAVNESFKYINEGLRDRAISRDLNWGIPLPFDGFDDKRLYVWFDAVLGYMSAGKFVAEQRGIDFEAFIRDGSLVSYYVHGKDNIVFHTIILPALLYAYDKNVNLPNRIVSCEYINLNNDKMSKSKGNLITVNSLLENFVSDSIRYYFTFNGPERKDSSFSLDDFIAIHNKHLVGGYGNFVNRNLSYLFKRFDGKLPHLVLDSDVQTYITEEYNKLEKLYEAGELRMAAEELYNVVQYANKYYDSNTPWTLANTDIKEFEKITSNCLYLMANIANMAQPIIPDYSKKVKELIGVKESGFSPTSYDESIILTQVPLLYNRINPSDIDLDKGNEDTLKEELK